MKAGRLRMVARGLLLAIIALLLAAPGDAAELTDQQRRDVLIEAQQQYDRGIALLRDQPSAAREAFRDAASRFELVIDSGAATGPLYYNLANARLQAGDLGRAILNYRRAERLMPGDARLASNLAYARSLRRTQIAPGGERALADALLWWHHHTATRTRFTIFLIAYVGCWLALTARCFRPGGGWTLIAGGLAVLWIALGASVAADVTGWGRQPEGVILQDDVIVRKGDGHGYEPRFEQPLHAGVEFDLLDQRGQWMYIRLPDGSEGWIESEAAELVP